MVRALTFVLAILLTLTAGSSPAYAVETGDIDETIFVDALEEVAPVADTYDFSGSSGSPYDGNVSSTLLDVVDRFGHHLALTDHYVFFRGGQYDYYLYFGDGLTLSGTSFTGANLGCLYISSTSSYSSHYTLEYLEGQSLNLSVGDYLVYSDLGFYPGLMFDTSYYDFVLVFVLIVVALCCFLYRIFKFTLRRATEHEQDC